MYRGIGFAGGFPGAAEVMEGGADAVLVDAAWQLLDVLEAAGVVVTGARAAADGTVILTEVDICEDVASMDDIGAMEIVIRRPTITEPPAWHCINGKKVAL